MYRLGLQLALKGGRETLVRLLLTTGAVAVGVAILLGVFADFHAFQKTSDRPSWESTTGIPVSSVPGPTSNAMLWHYSENIYKGQFIEQLDLAALGPKAPILPGISKLPGAGQFYASPALSNLLKTVPKDELGDRFPGRQVGTIGKSALSFPNELAIYIGRPPAAFTDLGGAAEVTHIATAPQLQGTTNMYREGFGIAAIAILFPLLILINTATKLAAARREERYAAIRLIGATSRQINVIASVDAIIGALFGAIVGSLIFLAIRPAVADISISGVKFFSEYVTPTLWGYIGMIFGVPIIAALASLVSLRRVRISPLGVSRKSVSKKPGVWRLVPLVAGAIVFPYAAYHLSPSSNSPAALFIGMLLIMSGLVVSGPWLTMQVTRLLALNARSAPSLLASRRLADNPKAAFRTVSGLVLAVFVGSFFSVFVPALNQAQNPGGHTSLNNVLRVPYNIGPTGGGVPAAQGAAIVSGVRSYGGATVLPVYVNPAFVAFQAAFNAAQRKADPNHPLQPPANPPNDSIVFCSDLSSLSAIGTCAPHVRAVTFNSADVLGGDNPLEIYKSLPVVTGNSPSISYKVQGLQLAGLLVKSNDANTLEKIRTYLTIFGAHRSIDSKIVGGNDLTAWQMGVFEPETIGEVAQIRTNDITNVGRAVLAIVALTLITAGCSVAVTVGGSLVERKRPFTLLRVTGVPLGILYRVILLEAALPLVIVSIVAAGVGLGVGIPVVKELLKNFGLTNVPVHPNEGYYVAMGAGAVAALLLVVVTLPLLRTMTKPEDARFE